MAISDWHLRFFCGIAIEKIAFRLSLEAIPYNFGDGFGRDVLIFAIVTVQPVG
ncbi:MAG: hypothetical protein RLZ62_2112 [Bacteroidota bacterium]|jgi:hypothetical protein